MLWPNITYLQAFNMGTGSKELVQVQAPSPALHCLYALCIPIVGLQNKHKGQLALLDPCQMIRPKVMAISHITRQTSDVLPCPP